MTSVIHVIYLAFQSLHNFVIDVRTQSMYQTMDPLFVGLIFSVYQSDKGSVGNQFQLTCFQAASASERRDVQIIIKNSPLEDHNLQGTTTRNYICLSNRKHI